MAVKKLKLKTKAQYVQEYLKCKNSFNYFCSNYIYLELPGGDKYITLYKPQSELIETINKHKHVLVLKSRQIGISTVIQAYGVWLQVFYKNVVIGVLSKDGPEATSFVRYMRGMLDKLPTWLKPGYEKESEQSYILKNGCKTFASTINPSKPENTLRGKAITFLIVDEGAFIKYMDEAWTGMIPALATNQRQAKAAGVPYGTVILSTPNKMIGTGKWFYERYCSAESGTDIFVSRVIHWKMIKELADDPEWYETQRRLAGNDEKKIMQELDLKFLAGSGSFFGEKTIIALQDIKDEPIEKSKIFGGEIWVFQKPIQGKFYLIGVDTASEYGSDFSAITVWDYETLEQVWEYHTKCKVQDFSKIVKLACCQYPGCCVVETSCGYGNNVAEEVDNSEFMLMLYKEKQKGVSNPNISFTKNGGNNGMRRGLSNNSKTRPLMIDSLYSYITEFPEIVKSRRLALELIGLTEKSGRVEADVGSKDDLALATACAFYVRKWDPPMVIDHSLEYQSTFSDILNMNEENDTTRDNTQLLKDIKEHLDENQGYVDILGMYSRE